MSSKEVWPLNKKQRIWLTQAAGRNSQRRSTVSLVVDQFWKGGVGRVGWLGLGRGWWVGHVGQGWGVQVVRVEVCERYRAFWGWLAGWVCGGWVGEGGWVRVGVRVAGGLDRVSSLCLSLGCSKWPGS